MAVFFNCFYLSSKYLNVNLIYYLAQQIIFYGFVLLAAIVYFIFSLILHMSLIMLKVHVYQHEWYIVKPCMNDLHV